MNQVNVPGMPFSFDGIIILGWVGLFLIVGMVLRANIPFFRRYLVPASIIGGLTGLIFQSSGLLNMTGFGLNGHLVQLIVYHLFNLTWIFLGLKLVSDEEKEAQKGKSASIMRMSVWIALAMIGVVALANFVAIGGTTILKSLGLNDGPNSLGALVAAGYTGGPGQTLTLASLWESASSFKGLSDFALAGASAGFAVSVMVGIPLMNIVARKRKMKNLSEPSSSEQNGFYNECDDTCSAGWVTTAATNIDVLAFHFAVGLGTYLFTLVLTSALCLVLPAAIIPLVWGVFFLLCCIMGIGVRKLIVRLHKGHLCCAGVNARITNSLVDFLVAGTFIGIELGSVSLYWQSFLLSAGILVIVIALCTWHMTKNLDENGPEYFAFLFGTWTGTISTGLVLLRMVDPENKSSVPVIFGIGNSLGSPGVVILTLVAYGEVIYGRPMWQVLTFYGLCAAIFLGLMCFMKIPASRKGWNG